MPEEAWATAEPTLGLIAAQISDTQMLEELAANDARELLDSLLGATSGTPCSLLLSVQRASLYKAANPKKGTPIISSRFSYEVANPKRVP